MSVSFRFIHAADLHLDSPFKGLSKAPEAVRKGLAESTFAALKKLTDLAIAEEVDFIVIAGDLFDEADRSLRAQLALLHEWRRLAAEGIAVYAIHGNHDHLGGKRAQMELPPNVHIFGAARPSGLPAYRRTGELAAYVYGMSYGERAETRNLAATYRTAPEAPYHIALLHGNVGSIASHDPYAPCTLEQLIGSGFDYWALGHIHKRELLHEYPHIAYAGNLQGRNPKETGAKGCYVVDVSEARKVDMRFIPLDQVRWLEEEVSIEGITTEQELLRVLERRVAQCEERQDGGEGCSLMLRLRLTGSGVLHRTVSQPASLAAWLDQLQASWPNESGGRWIYVYGLSSSTNTPIDWQVLQEEDSFAGELFRLSTRLQQNEEQWRELAGLAVAEMADHPKLNRIGREKWDALQKEWLQQAKELTLGLMAGDGDDNRRS
ncbi:DNA repair exonuclease [Paenibacillus sp. 1011MAR3C5]|uniref:metallophosphoesterase family protein n=1 Tax=Paenibacillus sp. 1011MAR3C5 TaxID=1675787 RepID=UPI000E6BE208|nr:DNA repair exonuclease [Paenibacillus sp. 1011MAR3C5]RJE90852.1 DNA repair exonuclease [Paenibacillus sp. 1011MAR3C5]